MGKTRGRKEGREKEGREETSGKGGRKIKDTGRDRKERKGGSRKRGRNERKGKPRKGREGRGGGG